MESIQRATPGWDGLVPFAEEEDTISRGSY
jgi:hypothetical protein